VFLGRGRDELLELLVIDTKTLRHGLHRLALAVQQQPTQVQLALPALITTSEPTENLRGEPLNHRANLGHLLRRHPTRRSHHHQTPLIDLTKPY
jgi:hypothetical protein